MDVSDLRCTVLTEDSGRHERAYRIVNAVWRRISAPDRVRILNAVSAWDFTQVNVRILSNWKHSFGTNAIIYISHKGALINIDEGYFDAADDEDVMTTIAHEIGHVRGSCDGDLSEDTAIRYQDQWGFRPGHIIYKDEACRFIDGVLSREGVPGEVFWFPDWQHYHYLPAGARLSLRASVMISMFDQPWATLKGLLLGYWPEELPEIAERATLADEFEGTERFAEYERVLTRITKECLPEELW
jgi:hypothetical protein